MIRTPVESWMRKDGLLQFTLILWAVVVPSAVVRSEEVREGEALVEEFDKSRVELTTGLVVALDKAADWRISKRRQRRWYLLSMTGLNNGQCEAGTGNATLSPTSTLSARTALFARKAPFLRAAFA